MVTVGAAAVLRSAFLHAAAAGRGAGSQARRGRPTRYSSRLLTSKPHTLTRNKLLIMLDRDYNNYMLAYH